jgi:diguanylate cyclase (GGDEF)-like protein
MFKIKFGNMAFDLIVIDGDNNDAEFDIKRIAEVADDHDFPILIIGQAIVRCNAQPISTGYCDLELLCRVNSLIRLENMQQELVRRVNTSETYGVNLEELVPPESDIGDTNILIIGSKSIILGNILLRLDTRARIQLCKNTENAISDLRNSNFDAVILSGVGPGDSNLRLANDIRADSRLFNIPLIMVLENGENREAAYIHGVSDIVLHDTEMDALINRTGLQIQQYRYRFAMQKLFRITQPYPLSDGLTGLYSYGFMKSHLTKMLNDHADREKYISVASIKIRNLEEINTKHGHAAGDQLLRQIGSILFNLVRGEDFCASYKSGHFVITLPGTRVKDAKIALKRIVGVGSNTEFSVNANNLSIQAQVSFGLAEANNDEESMEDIITRGFDYKSEDEKAA